MSRIEITSTNIATSNVAESCPCKINALRSELSHVFMSLNMYGFQGLRLALIYCALDQHSDFHESQHMLTLKDHVACSTVGI